MNETISSLDANFRRYSSFFPRWDDSDFRNHEYDLSEGLRKETVAVGFPGSHVNFVWLTHGNGANVDVIIIASHFFGKLSE